MANNLFLFGIGGFGARLAEEVSRKMSGEGAFAVSFAIDTDSDDLREINCDYKFDLSRAEKFISTLEGLSEKGINLFEQDLSELGYVKTLPMDNGSNMWRIKAMASFMAFISDEKDLSELNNALDQRFNDVNANYEVYVISSLAGGTGSALSLPMALYLKSYLKNKGVDKVKFTYFSACPDVFTHSLNAELRTKAYANAYASLSEINTVNTVALRKAESNFKVGYKTENTEVLFDGSQKEFHSKEYLPFDKIYLFDRASGVFSTEFHVNLIADYVHFILKGLCESGERKNAKDLSLFGSVSIAELDYSLENIVDYIAKFKAFNSFSNEWVKPYKLIEQSELFTSVTKMKKSEEDLTEEYAKKVESFLENLDVDKDKKTSFVLDRLEENDQQLTIDDNSWMPYYTGKCSNYLIESLKGEEYSALYNEFSLTDYSSTKTSKKQLLVDFTQRCEYLLNKLNQFYVSELEKLSKEDFYKIFTSTKIEDKDVSLLQGILMENGKFIHPTLALIRLSMLYLHLKKRVRAYCLLTEEELKDSIERKCVHDKLLHLSNCSRGERGYSSLKEDRFIRVIAGKKPIVDTTKLTAKQKKLLAKENKKYVVRDANKDQKPVMEDFKSVLEQIVFELRGLYVKNLISIVERILIEYKKVYQKVNSNLVKYKSDVADSFKERISQGVYYGIRTTEKDRKQDLNKYLSEIKNKGFTEQDDGMGSAFFNEVNLALTNGTETDGDKIVSEVLAQEKNRIYKSDFYFEAQKENIISAIIEPIDKKNERNYLKTALMLRPNLLTKNPVEEKECKSLYISSETADYVLNACDRLNIKSTESIDAVDQLLVNVGEYETQVKLLEGLSSKKAYVVSEKYGVKLSNLSKMNGDDDVAIYKEEYERAIKNVEKYQTAMWNPHLFEIDGKVNLVKIK